MTSSALLALTLVAGLADDPRPVSFKSDVAPILARRCLGCHNAKKAQSGLNMATLASLKKGGKTSGASILVPGDPEASGLIDSIRADAQPRMPYKEPPLSDAEIASLERWVKAGATFDGPSEAETPIGSLVDPLANLRKVPVKLPTSDPVTSIAISADGKRLAAAVGRTVQVFDLAGGKPEMILADHAGPLTGVAIVPDGSRLIATGGRPGQFGEIVVWDLGSKSKIHQLRGHTDSILSAALSPDGKSLATASYDRLVKVWDVATGKEIRTLKEHTDAVHAVAFSRDGALIASGSADRTVKVWDVATGKKRESLSDSLAEVYAVAFAPDGRSVIGAGADRSIRAWELKGDASTLIRSAFAHDAAVIRLVLSADGKTLVSGGEDRAVKLWDFPDLKPIATFDKQSDWPMALALTPDGARLAVGRYDGSIALLDAKTGRTLSNVRDLPAEKKPPKPELVRNASLNPPSPRGARRGTKVRVSLSGNGVGRANAVILPESGITAAILKRDKPDPNSLDVELNISADARVGVHRILVQTPLGTPGSQPFAVTDSPEIPEAEPNDEPSRSTSASLPATLTGVIDRPGDVDTFRFEARAGQDLVFKLLSRPLGSMLSGTLAVVGSDGKTLAEIRDLEASSDPALTFHVPADGRYRLRVSDADFGGSGAHFYRIRAGELPHVASVFPLGVDRSHAAEVIYAGVNLGFGAAVIPPGVGSDAARIDSLPGKTSGGADVSGTTRRVVSVTGRVALEAEPNDSPSLASAIDPKGGISGRIGAPGDVDHHRFRAEKGRRVIVETFGRRLGSPMDTAIEILDKDGKPVPRAVLRPVEETNVAFRDHPSNGRNLRLTQWNDFYENDYILLGRELSRIAELPRNPDDDAILWGTGVARAGGERIGLLDTTPEHHPQGQPIYKVEIHPPGSTFPRGGTAPVTLFYRNDDGGPGLGKDSKLTFDPPADGDYLVRVEDVRGLGGEAFGYHLIVREPREDFQISPSQENPNIPRGGTAILQVNATRIDGYDGPIEIAVEGLPPGITASTSRIERDAHAASVLLMADASAPVFSPPTWKLTGRATVKDRETGKPLEIIHEVDPGGPNAGFITVTPEPNMKVGFRPEKVEIRPGERVEMTLTVDRGAAFAGRVPIDVRNLPRGVRVLNIGLNGVLVTEKQTERSIFLYAEPWAEPTDRPFFAVGNCEPAGTEHSSPPIPLVVKRRDAGGIGP